MSTTSLKGLQRTSAPLSGEVAHTFDLFDVILCSPVSPLLAVLWLCGCGKFVSLSIEGSVFFVEGMGEWCL